MKVVFGLNYVGCDEIVEFDDDVTEEEFKNEKPTEKETKIDFSKYIKRK